MAIVDVIKYNNDPNFLAWKFPNEELGTWTQLIVNESQEAVLFKEGKALDVFKSGRHTLKTMNIPVLNNVINLPFGGRSPFTAEVWYVNKVNIMDIKWGTSTPIQLQDPKYSIFVPVRSFGYFSIQVKDSKKFLTSLVGSLPVFDKTRIVNYFRGIYLSKIKDALSSYLIHKQISIMEINAYIDELSGYICDKVKPYFDEYGIKLINFCINDINVPENDTAVITLKNALAEKAKMDIIGYDYQQERSFDTLEGMAKNPGSGSDLIGAGLGLGMGAAMYKAVNKDFNGITENINISNKNIKKCPNCNTDISKDKKFCPECGYKMDNEQNKALITCHECGAKLSGNNLKFCHECGTSLVKKCPNCSTVITGSSKFCSECGEKLE